jgi:hypothetical protein
MILRFATLVLVLVLPLGCNKKSGSSPSPGPSSTAARTPLVRQPTPPPREHPPIAEVSTINETKDGISVHVRLFAASVTKGDFVRFGFQLAKVGGTPKGAARERVDVSEVLSNLTFQITPPKGKAVELALGAKAVSGGKGAIDDVMLPLGVDGAGLDFYDRIMHWKEAAPQLLDAPGKYSLTIRGVLTTDQRTLTIESKPISFDVVAEGTRKTLAEIERIAAEEVAKKERLSAPPKPLMPTVEDVKGNLWTRFQLKNTGKHYDVTVVEVLVDPSGKQLAYDAYEHFTCVAHGTSIATPEGERPVEELYPGDRVISFDVSKNRRDVSVVRSIQRAHAEQLFTFGKLRVTGSHPVFVDGAFRPASELTSGGRFLGLDGRLVAHERSNLSKPTVVYDLSVSEPHTYFASGVLVHNKAAHVPIAGPSQPWRGWFHRRAAKR